MEWTDSQKAALSDIFYERGKAGVQRPGGIKVALIGSFGVGKACLAHRFSWGEYVDRDTLPFDQVYDMEYTKTVKVQGSTYWLIFDRYQNSMSCLAFPEEFASQIVKDYDACIFMFSVCNRPTFETMQRMYHAAFNTTAESGPVLYVAAGKADIEPWDVPVEEAEQFSRSINAKFLITSSKTGRGLGEDDAAALADYILHTKAVEREEKLRQQAEQAVANQPVKSPRRCSILRKMVQVVKRREQQ